MELIRLYSTYRNGAFAAYRRLAMFRNAKRHCLACDYESSENTGKSVSVGHLTGKYKQIHGQRSDYVYNATYFDDGKNVEWDGAIRLLTGELKGTPTGRFLVSECEGSLEERVRRLMEDYIERLAASENRD